MISIKTLQSLEYDKILYSVSKFAVLKETKKYLLNFKPETDYDTVKYLLDKTQEAYKLLYTHGVNCIEFFDEMSKYTDKFIINVQEPSQVILTNNTNDTTYNRVWIQAIMPSSMEGLNEIYHFVYGLDMRTPVYKIFRSYGPCVFNTE